MTFHYRCIDCGCTYPIETTRYLCDVCSKGQSENIPLKGLLETQMETDSPQSLPPDWLELKNHLGHSEKAHPLCADTRNLLPVPSEFFPSIPVGNTPLWKPERLRRCHSLNGLFLKDDTANPTGSLKDRASYLVAAFALQHGIDNIVAASTGNAGSSIAGVCAAANLKVRLYLPAAAPPAKIAQAVQYGADVIKVEGSYTDACRTALSYVAEHGGLSRITGHNPLTIEGKKTVSLEIFLQLGGVIPDIVYVSTGDGVIISGVYKGFEDLVTLGFARSVPRIVCVQAEGSRAISRALTEGAFKAVEKAETIADSISVDVPLGGFYALKMLQKYQHRCVTVSDQAILEAQKQLSSYSGLFAEPAAAAAYAGLLDDMENKRGPGADERVVILVTGNGLKDIDSAMIDDA